MREVIQAEGHIGVSVRLRLFVQGKESQGRTGCTVHGALLAYSDLRCTDVQGEKSQQIKLSEKSVIEIVHKENARRRLSEVAK